MKRIAIFASGTGSNFEALADDPRLKTVMEVAWLVCDRPQAPVIEKADKRGIATFVFRPKDYTDKTRYEAAILATIGSVDLIVLAGYMRLISPYFLAHSPAPILNLHPSLLPKYKGLDAIGQAYRAGDEEVGISVHLVTEELDGGPVVAQARLQHPPGESLADLTQRLHDLEHALLPQVVYQQLTEAIEVKGGPYA